MAIGRHSRGEGQGVLGILPKAQPILEYLLVRPVEARINEALGPARALAGDAFEEALARGGRLEDESRGEEDGRFQRAFRKGGIVAVAHHQRGRLEAAAADLDGARLRAPPRRCAGDVVLVLHEMPPVVETEPGLGQAHRPREGSAAPGGEVGCPRAPYPTGARAASPVAAARRIPRHPGEGRDPGPEKSRRVSPRPRLPPG